VPARYIIPSDGTIILIDVEAKIAQYILFPDRFAGFF
jgi:hypothetical protein